MANMIGSRGRGAISSFTSRLAHADNLITSGVLGRSTLMKASSNYTLNINTRNFSVEINTISMPGLSPTMTHGTIGEWKLQPGEAFGAGDVLCDIETDKASMGFEMQDEGVLAKILVDAGGSELACGEPIAFSVEDLAAYQEFLKMDPQAILAQTSTSEAAAAAPTSSAAPDSTAGTAAAGAGAAAAPIPIPAGTNLRFSPAARHMIESQSLEPSSIQGTSKGGLISKADVVLAVLAGTAAKRGSTAAALATAATSAATPTPAALPTTDYSIPVNSRYKDIPNTNMRKVIAKRLTESKATVPHLYTSIECEIDELLALRKTLKADLDVNVSVNDLVIKSAALALRDVPQANAKWNPKTQSVDQGGGRVDISVAVATPNGLITPIVTRADRRGLGDINACVKDLAGRARLGKLLPEEYQGGSFSVSNLGMFGISSFTAVINPPQACILAVGSGVSKILPPLPAADGKLPSKPRVATTVTVQLSSDRRVVDEATAAQFLQVFRKYFSNPKQTLL